jgi:hypothetical protein
LPPVGLIFFTFMALLLTVYAQEALHLWRHRRSSKSGGADTAIPGASEKGTDRIP